MNEIQDLLNALHAPAEYKDVKLKMAKSTCKWCRGRGKITRQVNNRRFTDDCPCTK